MKTSAVPVAALLLEGTLLRDETNGIGSGMKTNQSPLTPMTMNSPRLFASLLALATGLLASLVRAQSALPRETPLFITATKEDDRMDERIFPIGWSGDGKFAWLSRKVEEASDEGMWALSVLDTTNNKVVETVPFSFPDKPGSGVAKFWAKHGKAVQATLTKNGIKASAVVMDHLPVVLGRRRNYIVAADLALDEKKNDFETLAVKSFKVNLRLAEKKSVVFEKSYDTFMPFAVSLGGCFHSPDERFGVIVVTALERGYEGAPHPRVVEAMVGFQLEEP